LYVELKNNFNWKSALGKFYKFIGDNVQYGF